MRFLWRFVYSLGVIWSLDFSSLTSLTRVPIPWPSQTFTFSRGMIHDDHCSWCGMGDHYIPTTVHRRAREWAFVLARRVQGETILVVSEYSAIKWKSLNPCQRDRDAWILYSRSWSSMSAEQWWCRWTPLLCPRPWQHCTLYFTSPRSQDP